MQSPRDKALDRAQAGRQIAAAIRDAIAAESPTDFHTLIAYSERLTLCNRDSNLWFGYDLHNEDGECFDASGHFWNCGLKLCPECLAKSTRRNRKRLREAIALNPLRSGEYRQMLTFTFPKTELPLLKARKLMNDAWALFRKRSWFKRTIVGGGRSEEFTCTPTGYHYHMHVLAITKYVLWSTFRHEWTHCVRRSFQKNGIPLTIASSDGLIVANVKRISSLEGAINEVAKYITKSDSWAKVRQSDLLDIIRIRRFPRMFELFGTFKEALRTVSVEADQTSGFEDYLDTQCIADEAADRSWRDLVPDTGALPYLADLRERIYEVTQFRMVHLKQRYECATFRTPPSRDARDEGLLETFVERIAADVRRLERDRRRPAGFGFPKRNTANAWPYQPNAETYATKVSRPPCPAELHTQSAVQQNGTSK